MRLYDKLMAAPGTINDQGYFGAYTNLAKDLKNAQCFYLTPEVAVACEQVCMSKPSSILGAISHLRSPYPALWMEWEPNRRSILVHQNDKPKPLRMGCLILSNREGNKGTAIYAWEHKTGLDTICDEITLDPFGIIFDFSGESVNEPVMAQYARHVGVPVTREVWEKKYQIDRDQLLANSKWSKLSKVAAEIDAYIELEKASGIVPLYHCAEMFQSEIGGKLLRPGQQMYENFMEDLQGEFAYTQAFLLMLNTKNSVIAQKREDLSRFNKSRIKRRKLPVKEFIVTNLHLSKVVGNRASARGMSREAARLHLVRGHFKTKPSGVYWWSSHVRGGNEDEIAVRKNYKVSV